MRRFPMRAPMILVLVLLLLPLAVVAQDDAADARDVIARAFALLDEATYRYAFMLDTTQSLVDSSGNVFGTHQVYEIDGEASGDDYHDTIRLTVTPLENEADTQATRLERTRLDETFYVRLDALMADQLDVDAGWWAMDDLQAALGSDSVRGFSAAQIEKIVTPSLVVFDVDMIRDVTELEADEIDGVAVRVFDVELKAVETLLANADAPTAESLTALLENIAMLSQSEVSITHRLYIGADDGRLYRDESESRTYLPYLEFGGSGDPGFDIDITQTLTLDIYDYDLPVTIEEPDTFR